MSFHSDKPNWQERIICSSFYLAAPFPALSSIPLLWIIISMMRGVHMRDFARYHCYQTVLYSMTVHFFPDFFRLLIGILANFIGLLAIFQNSADALVSGAESIIQFYERFIIIVTIYALIWTLRGRFTYLPPISQAVSSRP